MTEEQNRKNNQGEVVKPQTTTPVRSSQQRLAAIGIVILILALSIIGAKVILNSKPKPKRRPPVKISSVVKVQEVKKVSKDIIIEAMGTVLSSRTLALKPSVSGTVQGVNENLVPGGLVKKGDVLISLDTRDYQFVYEKRKNELEAVLMDLRLEEGSQAVALREYELIKEYSGDSLNDAPMDLALRKPQLAKTKARAAAARTEMAMAQLNLERTSLTAPFNGIVIDKNVATGAQVNSQTTVATIADTDTYWVRVSLPQKDLALMKLPVDGLDGPQAEITNIGQRIGVEMWQGELVRILPDVDPKGLMVRILIAIDNPTTPQKGNLPLLIGSVVRAQIEGLKIDHCYPVPRGVLRPDQTVLIASDEDTLVIQAVAIAWQNDEEAYVISGLKEGDRLITSNIAAPIPGMALTVQH